jgi:hypothetical protein
MPDFELKLSSNVDLVDWVDGASAARPSRLNAKEGHPAKRLSVPVGETVTLTAVVGGVEGPLDATLGGRLFSGDTHEFPSSAPGWSSPTGQSSVQSFVPAAAGNYVVQLRHQGGGAILIHIDAEVAP